MTDKTAPAPAKTEPKVQRIRPPMARAIDFIAIDGCTYREAARRAGIHEVSLSKALAKPHVFAALETRKAEAALEAHQLKGIAKSVAIRVGIDLMNNATSEAVKAKMVEFFAGETRQPLVAVQINQPQSGGYTYARPDPQSGGQSEQAIDITPKDDSA